MARRLEAKLANSSIRRRYPAGSEHIRSKLKLSNHYPWSVFHHHGCFASVLQFEMDTFNYYGWR